MILNVLYAGGIGGIEKMCFDLGKNDKDFIFLFIKPLGPIFKQMAENNIYVDFVLPKVKKMKIFDIKLAVRKIEDLLKKCQLMRLFFTLMHLFLRL